jgi:hypothetical protein
MHRGRVSCRFYVVRVRFRILCLRKTHSYKKYIKSCFIILIILTHLDLVLMVSKCPLSSHETKNCFLNRIYFKISVEFFSTWTLMRILNTDSDPGLSTQFKAGADAD